MSPSIKNRVLKIDGMTSAASKAITSTVIKRIQSGIAKAAREVMAEARRTVKNDSLYGL